MQEAALSPLATWQNFYVIIGSASATLTGLMFVVITLTAQVRRRVSLTSDGMGVFSTQNIVHFGEALLIAAILVAPWQALWPVGLLLGLAGLVGVIYIIIVFRRTRRFLTTYQLVLEDWVWYLTFPLVSYSALIVAAMVLPSNAALALFVIGAATVLLLFIGIHNAWDVVTYLALEDSQRENKSRD